MINNLWISPRSRRQDRLAADLVRSLAADRGGRTRSARCWSEAPPPGVEVADAPAIVLADEAGSSRCCSTSCPTRSSSRRPAGRSACGVRPVEGPRGRRSVRVKTPASGSRQRTSTASSTGSIRSTDPRRGINRAPGWG
jgi:hypothetical protein